MRIALGLQYDGAAFCGWQTQPDGLTVQDHLEKALVQFIGAPNVPVKTITAGRTDTGVHALGQVVHFDTQVERTDWSWVRGVNAFLPSSIAVHWAKVVPSDFDARFSAFERTYAYALFTGPSPAPLLQQRVGYYMLPADQSLDIGAMRAAAACLIGEKDFSSFRSSECQSKTPIKTVYEIQIHGQGPWVYVVIRANAFLQHMVRNIVGSLLTVGSGKENPSWLKAVLDAKSRQVAAPTFMPDGLYLVKVGYPDKFDIPKPNLASSIIPASILAKVN